MSLLLPHQYEKRILLVVTGMSPQIMTETIYALTQTLKPSFVPTEVHLVTTQRGAEQARLNLLVGDDPYFYRLCKDYRLDSHIFSRENIHIIKNERGLELEDIRTPEENSATANFITQLMHRFCRDDSSALHVSIAGGRKTMGYYAGYALSLYGRNQDRLSHVLVSEGYEGLRDFYYPTPYSQPVFGYKNEALDAQKAEVTLAQIPFIPLRGGVVSESLLDGNLGFNETVERAKQSYNNPTMLLDPFKQTIQVGATKGKLKPGSVMILLWLNYRLQRGQKEILRNLGSDFNATYAEEIVKAADYLDFSINKRTYEYLTKGKGVDNSFLETQKSRLNSDLAKVLGPDLAKCFQLQGVSGKNSYILPNGFKLMIEESF